MPSTPSMFTPTPASSTMRALNSAGLLRIYRDMSAIRGGMPLVGSAPRPEAEPWIGRTDKDRFIERQSQLGLARSEGAARLDAEIWAQQRTLASLQRGRVASTVRKLDVAGGQ